MRGYLALVTSIQLLGSVAYAAECDCVAFAGKWQDQTGAKSALIRIEIAPDCSSKIEVTGEEIANSARIDSLFCDAGTVKAQFRMAPGALNRNGEVIPYPHNPAVKKALEGTVRSNGSELFFELAGVEDRFEKTL